MPKKKKALTEAWLKWYCDRFCTLCGYSGIIDTRGVKTATGVEVGRLNWCICPNGVAMRRGSDGKSPTERDLEVARS